MDAQPTQTETIRCDGRRRDGRSCRAMLAELRDGQVIIRDHGRMHINPASTSCPKCTAVMQFRDGGPEPLISNPGTAACPS